MSPKQPSSRSKEFEMIRAMKSGFEKVCVPKSTARAVLAACALFAAGSVELCLAGPSSQTTFASPEDASHALASAVQQHDERAVGAILGGGSGLTSSNDKAEDALNRERFAQKYQEMHRLVRVSGGVTTLYIGAENWPFPVPLVSRNGMWRFDTKIGSEEIRFRRIGENEVTAIGMCATLAIAEEHPGSDGEADRLVKTLLPEVERANKPILFRGYYFRILPNSGSGFAAIAYPATYRSSGVKTFIVTQNGGVAEKDLGPNTAHIAGAMTGYHADASWTPAE
jgi:hypothetical protein